MKDGIRVDFPWTAECTVIIAPVSSEFNLVMEKLDVVKTFHMFPKWKLVQCNEVDYHVIR